MIKYHWIEQNTEAWHSLRTGRFTASSADKLLSDPKTKGYQDLISRVGDEQFTGEKSESIKFSGNAYTERGHELEQQAIDSFEFEYIKENLTVKPIGFVECSKYIGCSPDGFVGTNLIQVKCPIFTTQEGYLSKLKVPGNYYKQMQFEMLCTGSLLNYFYSYHPRLKSVCIPVDRDKKMIIEIAKRLRHAINEVEERLEKLK